MSQPVDELDQKDSPPAPVAYSMQPSASEDVIDLRFLFQVLLRWWWFILLVTLLTAAKGVWDMHTFTQRSIASMVVAPVETSTVNLTPGSQNAGLSGALGNISFGATREATKFDRLIHAASTLALARALQEKYGLMQILYEGAWDPETQTWRQPMGSDFERRERINRFLKLRTWTEPDLEDLAGYLGGSLKVEDIAGTPFKEISFTHGDSEVALWLLKIIFKEATELLRTQDREELTRRKTYLEARLRETRVIEFQHAIVDLLAGEARREMLLQAGLPYAARIIEPAHLSKYKTQPNQLRYLGVPMIIGFAGACVLVLLVALVRHE